MSFIDMYPFHTGLTLDSKPVFFGGANIPQLVGSWRGFFRRLGRAALFLLCVWGCTGCAFRHRPATPQEMSLDQQRYRKAEQSRKIIQSTPIKITRSLREDLRWLQARLQDDTLVLRRYQLVFSLRPPESAVTLWGYASMVRAAEMYLWIAQQVQDFLLLHPPSRYPLKASPKPIPPKPRVLQRSKKPSALADNPRATLQKLTQAIPTLQKSAYKMYLMTLFVGFFYRQHLPQELTHQTAHNPWLRIAAQSRRDLAVSLKYRPAQHQNILQEIRNNLQKSLRYGDPRGYRKTFDVFAKIHQK
ncbi:MAG: hypothetical protein H6727_09750 [Myxococcales bacterium]|nr:hypothetical protein [Myxococcales bacterium]